MPELLALWHAEHAKFGRLLAIFEREVEAFSEGGEPDYTLMADIVEYLHGYGDTYHHPREDIGFRRLVQKDPGSRQIVQRLLQEHRVIAEGGKALLTRLQRQASGEVMPRSTIEGAAATYLVYYRHHLIKEEGEVLPRVGACFTEADWQAVAAELASGVDPLFGNAADARFAALRKEIARAAGSAPAQI